MNKLYAYYLPKRFTALFNKNNQPYMLYLVDSEKHHQYRRHVITENRITIFMNILAR